MRWATNLLHTRHHRMYYRCCQSSTSYMSYQCLSPWFTHTVCNKHNKKPSCH